VSEIAALSAKGVVALDHFGPFVALFAFFALMPLGHLTIGVLLVVLGQFYPGLATEHEPHEIKIGSGSAKLEIKGSARTMLTGIGGFVIALSFAELAVR